LGIGEAFASGLSKLTFPGPFVFRPAEAFFAGPDDSNVQLFGDESCDRPPRKTQQRTVFFVAISQAAAHAADQMLVPGEVGIEPSHAIRCADPADKPFVLEELENSVNGRVRQGRHVAAKPGVDRVGRWVTRIRHQSLVNCHTLGSDPDAALAASIFEALAPVRDFLGRPRRWLPHESKAAGGLCTSSYHMRNITI
jgi:hypothetical protein